MTKFRKGDLCTIQVVIASHPHGDNDVRVEQPNTYGDLYVKQADLTIIKHNFAVGDSVTWSVGDSSHTGHVLSLHGDHLWVDLGNAEYATVWAGKAMRLDPETEETAEAA